MNDDLKIIDPASLQSDTVIGFQEIEAPKHEEMLSTYESMNFQPWRVAIMVVLDEGHDPIEYYVYLRCQDPITAQMMAVATFEHYEKKCYGVDLKSAYPRLHPEPHICDRLTESQYYEFWKEAQMGEYRASGKNTKNPQVFVIYSQGWNKAKRIYQRGFGAITVPDTSDIKKYGSGRSSSEEVAKAAQAVKTLNLSNAPTSGRIPPSQKNIQVVSGRKPGSLLN